MSKNSYVVRICFSSKRRKNPNGDESLEVCNTSEITLGRAFGFDLGVLFDFGRS